MHALHEDPSDPEPGRTWNAAGCPATVLAAVPSPEGRPPVRVGSLGPAEAVPGEEWNRLARRGFHLHAWYAAAERCGWQPRHLGLWAAGGLQGIVPAYLMTGKESYSDLHDRWLGPLSEPASRAGLRLRPTLAVTAPYAMTADPLGDPAGWSAAVIEEIFDALEEQAGRDGAKAVVWPLLDAGASRILEVGRRRGYIAAYAGATAGLAVRWSSFDDYVAGLSKNVRRTVRADLRTIDAAGLRLVELADFGPHASDLDALYRTAYLRRNQRPTRLPPDLFRELASEPTAGLWAQLTYCGERLVGTSLNLEAGGVVDGTFAAFASEFAGGPAYYNDLVYAPLRLACRRGYRHLALGPTALYPKVLRGAKLRRQLTLVRGSSPAAQAVLRLLARANSARTEQKEHRALRALARPDLFDERDA